MLDMHDTLFTSNPMHLYSSRHSSYIDYSPQTCGIPSYSGYHNIQPALDHLHPYYQVSFSPIHYSNCFRIYRILFMLQRSYTILRLLDLLIVNGSQFPYTFADRIQLHVPKPALFRACSPTL